MKEPSPDPYEVLDLGRTATAREVARAYRALVRAHHPDTRTAEPVPAGTDSGAQALQDIMDAYAVLGDPVRRAAYDRQRHESPPPEPVLVRRPHPGGAQGRRSAPALIIGPVRWEDPEEPVPGQQVISRQDTGRWDLFDRLQNRGAVEDDELAPGGYWLLGWIRR